MAQPNYVRRVARGPDRDEVVYVSGVEPVGRRLLDLVSERFEQRGRLPRGGDALVVDVNMVRRLGREPDPQLARSTLERLDEGGGGIGRPVGVTRFVPRDHVERKGSVC